MSQPETPTKEIRSKTYKNQNFTGISTSIKLFGSKAISFNKQFQIKTQTFTAISTSIKLLGSKGVSFTKQFHIKIKNLQETQLQLSSLGLNQ